MAGPWEEYQDPEKKKSVQSKGPWEEYQNAPQATSTEAVDNSKYQNAPASTFAANAINSLTFGLPDYLNKTFTPQTYAEGQRYQEANPLAANLGTASGEVAGYAVPGVYGAVKGGQLGVKAVNALSKKLAPELSANETLAAISRLYGRAVGATTGGTMGAQTGAALPGVVQGDPGKAVAASELVNQYASQIPGVSPLGGLTGHIVPAIAGGAASLSQNARQSMAVNTPTGYTPNAQEARNILASGDERMINLYGGRLKLQGLASPGPNAFNSGFSQELKRMG